MASPPTIFISYSRPDEPWKDRLVEHLGVLVSRGLLDVWDDSRIMAGASWRSEIEQAIERASVAVLLITRRFLASDYVQQSELPALLERRQSRGLRIIPVLVGPCDWKAVPWLTQMQLRLRNGQAISSFKDHEIDEDFAKITEEIRLHLHHGQEPSKAAQRAAERAVVPAALQPEPGIRLDELLRAHAPLSEPVAVSLAWKILAEIAGAHARGVAHGSISARNIWLRRSGTELTPRLSVAMTSGAPEGEGRKPPSLEQDIFAFGSLLREMLHGQSTVDGKPLHVSSATESALSMCLTKQINSRRTADVVLALLGMAKVDVSPPAAVAPFNLGFEGPVVDGMPLGWFNSVGFVAGVSNAYEVSVVDRADRPHGKCALIERAGSSTDEFGSLMQRCPAKYLAGRTIRLEGTLRSEGVVGGAGLWLRVDAPGHTCFFDNMSDRPIRGSTPWRRYSICADGIDPEVDWLNFGVILTGDGRVWADDLSVLYLDPDENWVPLDLG